MAHFVSTVYATHTSVGSYFLLSVTLGFRLRPAGYAETGTPKAIYVTRASEGLKVRLAIGEQGINIFLTAFGRVKSGLKPAVKNRAAHGGEDCAQSEDQGCALGMEGQAPICRAIRQTEGERNLISPVLTGR